MAIRSMVKYTVVHKSLSHAMSLRLLHSIMILHAYQYYGHDDVNVL